MAIVTIITPTYNRADKLPHLYESLKKQTNQNFEWLVIDDGSTDNTAQVVDGFSKDSNFEISYFAKNNGGKHTALNIGIKEIKTELTIIVDSDDSLLPDAVEEITQIHNRYKENSNIATYTFLRCYSNGKPIISLETEELVANYISYRIKGNRPGDMAEVFKTDVLKANPFPEFLGERFLSEDVVWIEIGKKYDSVFINKPIYECEYLEGGLTANDKLVKFASPLGSMLRGKQLMSKECGLKQNIKGAIIFNCYNSQNCTGEGVRCERFREHLLVAITKPLGLLYRRKWSK